MEFFLKYCMYVFVMLNYIYIDCWVILGFNMNISYRVMYCVMLVEVFWVYIAVFFGGFYVDLF